MVSEGRNSIFNRHFVLFIRAILANRFPFLLDDEQRSGRKQGVLIWALACKVAD